MVDKRTSVKNKRATLNLLLLNERRMIHSKTECSKNVSDNNASLSRFFVLERDRRERQTQKYCRELHACIRCKNTGQ